MLRRKPTLLEVRLEDKEELAEARKKAASAAALAASSAASSASSQPSSASKSSGAALLYQLSSKGSVTTRIGFNNH